MKKVLILCIDFPPLSTISAQRPFSWFQDFHTCGIFPVVITRHWNKNIKSQEDKFKDHPYENEVIKSEHSEQHKLKPRVNRRNSIIIQSGFNKNTLQRKILTYRDQLLAFFNMKFDEHAYLYDYARDYLKNNEVDCILVTAGPFILFRYAHLLHREFGIPWIADYRDAWKGNPSFKKFSLLQWPVNLLGNFKEKEWTSDCLFFTTVSPPLVESISKQIHKKGYLIRNGVDLKLIPENKNSRLDCFELFFAGTLYDSAYIDLLMDGILLFFRENKVMKNTFRFSLVGIGLNETRGTKTITEFASKHKEWIEISETKSQDEVIKLESRASVLLSLVPGSMHRGIYSGKIYEYLALNKPVIHLESDVSGQRHEFSDYVLDCHTAAEFSSHLGSLYRQWKENNLPVNNVPDEVIREFDRSLQSQKIAALILKHL